MNIEPKAILRKLQDFGRKNQRYASFIFFIAVLILYSFLVYQISRLALSEPSEAAVTEQIQNTGRIKVDEQSLQKIQQLQDQNVQVQSLFESARDNPFQD